jgi:hypothetical protein
MRIFSGVRHRWHAHQAWTQTARTIALRPARRARDAMQRANRLDAAPGRSWKARGLRFLTAVPMRSPPYEARGVTKTAVPRDWGCYFSRGSSFEKRQAVRGGWT